MMAAVGRRRISERAGCLAFVIAFYAVGLVIVAVAVATRDWVWLAMLVIYIGPTIWMLQTRPLQQTRTNVDLTGPEATPAEFTNEPWRERKAREAAEANQWPSLTPPRHDVEPDDDELDEDETELR